MIQRIKFIIPFLVLFALLILLWRELYYSHPNELPSALIGEAVPTFSLRDINNPQKQFTQKDLRGQVSLLNVWATWCYACGMEHAMLMKIYHDYRIPIFSIAYKDNIEDAKNWLREKGNPYRLTGDDRTGDVAIDLGVYGTPETFIINPEGKIVYRHIGAIDQKTWDEVLYPLIRKYQHA